MLKNVGFSVILIFLLMVSVEFGLRAFDVVSGRILLKESDDVSYQSESAPHPYLAYTSRPNFKGTLHFIEPFETFTVQTNSHGFRTHEFYPKLPNEYRILVLGDSFMFGFNANQDKTVASQLETLAHDKLSKNIKVYNLGVASYSAVRYAELARIYFDYLKPDLVIVAVDQSDFEEDLQRYSEYLLDSDGVPLILKDYEYLTSESAQTRTLAMDGAGKFTATKTQNWLARLEAGSSLFKYTSNLFASMRRLRAKALYSKKVSAEDYSSMPLVRYEDLVAKYGDDFSKGIPYQFLRNTVPKSLERAKKEYRPTLLSLEFIAKECAKAKTRLYLASYPYPWMVTLDEALPYLKESYQTRFDMRGSRVAVQLMDDIAAKLKSPHLNAYPLFEKNASGMYGRFDPHFNEAGYSQLATFLWESISPVVASDLES